MSLEDIIEELCDNEAASYCDMAGHSFSSDEEKSAWTDELHRSIELKDGQTCIDVGAGTGVLTHLIASFVGSQGKVIAHDLSSKSLAINKETLPSSCSASVDYLQGDAHDKSLFLPKLAGVADFIFARQSVVLFQKPQDVFKIWQQLLKPDGKIVILDALWTRSSWTGEWSNLIDSLPLSCLQTLGTIPYMLESVGFSVSECRYLDRVNQVLGEEGTKCPRFIVVAKNS